MLKSRGCWIPSIDLLQSTEYGADSSNCCHGVKGKEWCPVAQSEKPLSLTNIIRIVIAVKWDNLPIADVFPATVGHYQAVQEKQQKPKCVKAGRVVDVPWPGCSSSIWEEPTDKGCCARVTFPRLSIGMNNEGHSPCLSLNSIFTPCQIHLGAFHHRCSPSARFSQ